MIPTMFFLGYLPRKSYFSLITKEDLGFYKYQRWGKDEKRKWVAPWKVLITISLLIAIVSYHALVVPIIIKGAVYAGVAILSLLAIGYLVYRFSKTGSWIATKSFLRSVKEKTCLRVVVTNRSGEQ